MVSAARRRRAADFQVLNLYWPPHDDDNRQVLPQVAETASEPRVPPTCIWVAWPDSFANPLLVRNPWKFLDEWASQTLRAKQPPMDDTIRLHEQFLASNMSNTNVPTGGMVLKA